MMDERTQWRQNVVSSLEKISKLEKVQGTQREDIIKRLIERLTDRSFRIAVVGEFSSGKSTFLNALMGRDILKHGAVETTATITEIENVPEANAETCDIYYRDGKSVLDIPSSELENYTVTSSKVCDVAKDVRKVVIKSHILNQ